MDQENTTKEKTARKRGRGFTVGIIFLEVVFSFFLYASLAEKVFVVVPASALAPVPDLISYQGMLTNSSGTPLGGSAPGSVYCFQYTIWDTSSTGASSSTDQLWPSVAAGNGGTNPHNSTTTVINGVFSDQIGRVDSLSGLDFESTSTYYLQVAVETSSPSCAGNFETLFPRQQIVSNAWAQTAQAVDGNLLYEVYASGSTTTGTVYLGSGAYSASNGRVQVGAGTGAGAAGQQTMLTLDSVNAVGAENIGSSCTQQGSLWYDTKLGHIMVCENSQMLEISNATGTAFNFPYWNASGTNPSATSSLYFSSSTGNIGVGTATPSTAFQVVGTTTLATTTISSSTITALNLTTLTMGGTATFNSTISQSGGLVGFASTTITGHLISAGTAPTISPATCGIVATSHDTAGSFKTTGSITSTGCTLTFNNLFTTNPPICIAGIASGTFQAVKASSTLSTVVILPSSTFATGTIINYYCIGI
jgi:hypothetical protein